MRTFDYLNLPHALFERRAGDLNALLHQDKGKVDLLKQLHPDVLAAFERQARFDNVDASLRIEGLRLSEDRLRAVLAHEEETYPERPADYLAGLEDVEAQAFGYARALRAIEQQADELELSSATMVRIFETLYANKTFGKRSRYRREDYMQVLVDGHARAVQVSPIVAFETPLVFGAACDSLAQAFDADRCSPLILAAVFTVDLLCIRPFAEGNGRVARLAAALLMEKAHFDIFRYVSVDAIIAQDAAAYYDALNACVEGWERARGDYRPFVEYWFACIHAAYEQLFERVEVRASAPSGKAERVRAFVEHAAGPVTKRAIMQANPDISIGTVEAALGRLVKDGAVRKVGSGRATAYEFVPRAGDGA